MKKVVIKKYISLQNKASTYMSIFFIVLIIFNFFGLIYSVNLLVAQQQDILSIKSEIKAISEVTSVDSTTESVQSFSDYYIELTNKTDEAINRILTVVGILSAFVAFFGVLLAFKAPKDIEKRLEVIKGLVDKADASALEAKYQADILEALNVDYDGELTNLKRLRQISLIIKKYPDKHDAYMHKGFLYDNMSQTAPPEKKEDLLRRAIVEYEIAHELGADSASCYNDIGVAYSHLGEHNQAIVYFTKALAKDPDHPAFYYNRGGSYIDIGEYKKALDDCNQSLLLDPENDAVLYVRAKAYICLAAKEFDNDKKLEFYKLAKNDLEFAKKIDVNKKMYTYALNSVIAKILALVLE